VRQRVYFGYGVDLRIQGLLKGKNGGIHFARHLVEGKKMSEFTAFVAAVAFLLFTVYCMYYFENRRK